MAKSTTAIRREVDDLLVKCGVWSPPVPVERIAKHLGATVKYQPFEGELAGMLVTAKDTVVIGVNSTHHLNRQRFTIAHELGHLILHHQEADAVHIDRAFKVHRRDEVSSRAVDSKEIEANRFAAELLMPYSMMAEDIVDVMDIEDEDEIALLAKRYQVSSLAMTHRISNLLQLHKHWL